VYIAVCKRPADQLQTFLARVIVISNRRADGASADKVVIILARVVRSSFPSTGLNLFDEATRVQNYSPSRRDKFFAHGSYASLTNYLARFTAVTVSEEYLINYCLWNLDEGFFWL
jgi:hypothetical protein